jgi:peptidoglycan/LPS O-acetylase OafA/YrhL
MANAEPMIGNTRLNWIEWVRGIAAALVVIAHFLAGVLPEFDEFSRTVLDLGRVGVVAFFLVSGFVVPLSYRRQTTGVFVVRRVSRLYPVYLVVLAVTVVFFYPRADWSSASWWGELLLNTTMLQQLFGATIITVAWTLAIELVYYFQQIFFKTIKLLDLSWVLGYFWAVVFVGAILGEHVLQRELPISFPMLLAVSCIGHGLSLVYGGLLASRHVVLMTLVVAIAIVSSVAFRAGYDPLWPPLLYITSFLGGLLFFAAAFAVRNRFELRWAIWLGGISYALYLSHSVTGEFIRQSPPELLWPAFCAATVTAVASAWLLHKFVEQPFIRLGRSYKPTEKTGEPRELVH